MKASRADMFMQNKVFLWIALATGAILLIPLIAMQFAAEVDWSLPDFVIIGALLFGMGLLFVLAARKFRGGAQRLIIGLLLAVLLLYLWAELAVGIFTNWGS